MIIKQKIETKSTFLILPFSLVVFHFDSCQNLLELLRDKSVFRAKIGARIAEGDVILSISIYFSTSETLVEWTLFGALLQNFSIAGNENIAPWNISSRANTKVIVTGQRLVATRNARNKSLQPHKENDYRVCGGNFFHCLTGKNDADWFPELGTRVGEVPSIIVTAILWHETRFYLILVNNNIIFTQEWLSHSAIHSADRYSFYGRRFQLQ